MWTYYEKLRNGYVSDRTKVAPIPHMRLVRGGRNRQTCSIKRYLLFLQANSGSCKSAIDMVQTTVGSISDKKGSRSAGAAAFRSARRMVDSSKRH